jgi:oligosaccharide repeat unit polymerase
MNSQSLLFRVPFLLFAAIPIALIPDGTIVFWAGSICIFLCLLHAILTLDGYLRLDIGFMLGFLLIVGFEGLINGGYIKDFVGIEPFGVAARVLVCGAFAILIGHDLTFRFDRRPRFKLGPDQVESAFKWVRIYMIGISSLFALVYVPYIIFGFTMGRSAGFGAVNSLFSSIFPLGVGALLGHLGMNGGLVFPSIIVYYFRFVRRSKHYLIISCILAFPCFLGLLGSGTRSRLFLAAIGFGLCLMAGHKFNFAKQIKVALLGLLVFAFAMVMSDARSSGWSNISPSRIFSNSEKYVLFFNENVVQTMTKLDDMGRIPENRIGHYSTFYAIFWIPRVFWHGKPVAIENEWWKIYKPEIRRSSSYAGSTSFAGPFFADFGAYGAVGILFLLGLAFGRLDVFFYRRMICPGDPLTPFAAVLFPASVFFARQVGTIYFWSVYMFLLCFGMYFVVAKWGRSRR